MSRAAPEKKSESLSQAAAAESEARFQFPSLGSFVSDQCFSSFIKKKLASDSLSFSNEEIDYVGLESLLKNWKKFPQLANVKKIDISKNPLIGDKGSQYLSKFLSKNKTVEEVIVSESGISKHGLLILTKGLSENNTLRSLLAVTHDMPVYDLAELKDEFSKILCSKAKKHRNVALTNFEFFAFDPISSKTKKQRYEIQEYIGKVRKSEGISGSYTKQDAEKKMGTIVENVKIQESDTLMCAGLKMQSPDIVYLVENLRGHTFVNKLDFSRQGIRKNAAILLIKLITHKDHPLDHIIDIDFSNNDLGRDKDGFIDYALRLFEKSVTLKKVNIANTGIAKFGAIAILRSLSDNNFLSNIVVGGDDILEDNLPELGVWLKDSLKKNMALQSCLIEYLDKERKPKFFDCNIKELRIFAKLEADVGDRNSIEMYDVSIDPKSIEVRLYKKSEFDIYKFRLSEKFEAHSSNETPLPLRLSEKFEAHLSETPLLPRRLSFSGEESPNSSNAQLSAVNSESNGSSGQLSAVDSESNESSLTSANPEESPNSSNAQLSEPNSEVPILTNQLTPSKYPSGVEVFNVVGNISQGAVANPKAISVNFL